MKKKLLSILSAGAMVWTALPTFPATALSEENEPQVLATNEQYTYSIDGLNVTDKDYSLDYKDRRPGCCEFRWDTISDEMNFTVGLEFDGTRTHKQFGLLNFEYDVVFEPNSNAYFGYSGTFSDTETYGDVDFFIIEAWGVWRPGGTKPTDSAVINGKQYDIFQSEKLLDDGTLRTQYWSVVQNNPAKFDQENSLRGLISFCDHFEAWEEAGLDMSGKLENIDLLVSSWNSSGSIDIQKNMISNFYAEDGQDSNVLTTKDGYTYSVDVPSEYDDSYQLDYSDFPGCCKMQWDKIDDEMIFTDGMEFGGSKAIKQYYDCDADYIVDFTPNSNAYFGYSGTFSDTKEHGDVDFFIIEAWGNWRPGGIKPLTSATIDGKKYDIFQSEELLDDGTLRTKYWSVVQNNPAKFDQKNSLKGHISISDHFKAWEKEGLDMSGYLEDINLLVDSWQSSGAIDIHKNYITTESYLLPDWVPNDYTSALEFRNTYGVTHVDGQYVCLVYVHNAGDAVQFGGKDDEDAALIRISQESYLADASLGAECNDQCDVIVFQANKPGTFPTYPSEPSIFDYSFSVSEDLTVEETDIYSWLPDSRSEYSAFKRENSGVGVRDGLVCYCDMPNGSTGYGTIDTQSGDGELEHIKTQHCNGVAYRYSEGGSSSLYIDIYRGKKDGLVDMTWDFARPWIPDEWLERTQRTFLISDDGKNVEFYAKGLDKNSIRFQVVDYDSGLPIHPKGDKEYVFSLATNITITENGSKKTTGPIVTWNWKEENPFILDYSEYENAEVDATIRSLDVNLPEYYVLQTVDEIPCANGCKDVYIRLKPTADHPNRKFDANGDRKFNMADLVLVHKYLTGKKVEFFGWKNWDANGDGICTISDFTLMKRALIG